MAEEDIYLPHMISKGCTIPDKKISVDHTALLKVLDEIEAAAKAIIEAKGLNSSDEIAKLKKILPSFEKDMNGMYLSKPDPFACDACIVCVLTLLRYCRCRCRRLQNT